jgi:hypothetical protein
MRKILGTVGAALAIAAVAGGWLSTPNNLPLGDGVDQATSIVLQVPEREVTGDGRQVSGPNSTASLEFPASADEQRTQFI